MILGIDLGTTHSAVGVVDSGFPILLADEDGKRIMPSAVWYGANGEVEVGRKALRRRAVDPLRVVTSVKRWMGGDFSEDMTLAETGKTPEEVSADILRELKRVAEWRLGEAVGKAVITVPAYFNDGQRAATKRAGELAGLEVVRILNEPTAAALAYGLDKLKDRARVAVYDLGGGTFDVTILEMEDGVFQVLATHGNTRLGGDDVDGLIFDWMADGLELERGMRLGLLEETERAKRELSSRDEVTIRVPFLGGDRGFEKTLTREILDGLTGDWIARTIRCCRQVMLDSGLSNADLDAVVLVGGSTRMPAVRKAVADFFGREVDVTQHPDEAIALGATIQAGVMSGAMRKMVLLDVTPLSLGIETFGGLMNVLIPRNTTIPCKAGEMFTNAADGQEKMGVRVLQGEREMARDNWELGKFEVEMEKLPKGQARVGVQFRIDADGILEVLAREISTGKDVVVKIENSAVNVDDAAVEEMVSASVKHAFEDMSERIFTEAKVKADELVPAVEMILAQGLVEDEEREEVEVALFEVKAAVESGSANRLKAAVQKLDTATEAAAARLVEKAMEAALEKELGQ